MLPRRKVEAEICLTSFKKLLWAEMNNSQKCPFLCTRYRGTRKASLEMSQPKGNLLRSSGLSRLISRGSDLRHWAKILTQVGFPCSRNALQRQNDSSDASEMLFRWQVCPGDSLFWFGREKVEVMLQLTGHNLCNVPSICVMELHVIQGMRHFIKFYKQESP